MNVPNIINFEEICYKTERIVNDLIFWGFYNSLEEIINNYGSNNPKDHISFAYDGNKVWMLTRENYNNSVEYLRLSNSNIKLYIILIFEKSNENNNEYSKVKIYIRSIFNNSLNFIKIKEIEENCICSKDYYSGFLPDQNLNDIHSNYTFINPDHEFSFDSSDEDQSNNEFSFDSSDEDQSNYENLLPDDQINQTYLYEQILKNIIYQIYGLSNIIDIIPEFLENTIFSCKLCANDVAEYRIRKLIYNEYNWNMNFENELYKFVILREDDLIIVKMRTMDGNILTYDVPESNLIFKNPWEIENYWNIKYDCSDGCLNTERFD